jgi:hypothetical protein
MFSILDVLSESRLFSQRIHLLKLTLKNGKELILDVEVYHDFDP